MSQLQFVKNDMPIYVVLFQFMGSIDQVMKWKKVEEWLFPSSIMLKVFLNLVQVWFFKAQ